MAWPIWPNQPTGLHSAKMRRYHSISRNWNSRLSSVFRRHFALQLRTALCCEFRGLWGSGTALAARSAPCHGGASRGNGTRLQPFLRPVRASPQARCTCTSCGLRPGGYPGGFVRCAGPKKITTSAQPERPAQHRPAFGARPWSCRPLQSRAHRWRRLGYPCRAFALAVSHVFFRVFCFNDSSSLPLIFSLPESACEAPDGQKPTVLPPSLAWCVHSSFKAGLEKIVLVVFFSFCSSSLSSVL